MSENKNVVEAASLLRKGLAVVEGEIRCARPDCFSYVSKKTGQKQEVKLIRIGIEVGEMAEQAEATLDAEKVPVWAVRGKRALFGCSEYKRENRRLTVRIAEAILIG